MAKSWKVFLQRVSENYVTSSKERPLEDGVSATEVVSLLLNTFSTRKSK